MMRVAVAILGLLALGGCAAEAPLKEEPAFYLSMAHGGAKVDPVVAASMISRLPPEQRPRRGRGRSRADDTGGIAVDGDGQP